MEVIGVEVLARQALGERPPKGGRTAPCGSENVNALQWSHDLTLALRA
jgi:hypothetical protein